MRSVEVLQVTPPFDGGGSWSGEYKSVDDAPAGPFTEADVADVMYQGDTGDAWDGTEAVVLRLHDGRFVAWETWWGPTGDGFHEDAYGGDTDIFFGYDLNHLILSVLSDAGRRLCGIPTEGLS